MIFVLVGFIAQIIDGTLGMAYGISCRSFLLLTTDMVGASMSAVIHFSEIFTTFISGICHFKLRNINKEQVKRLLIPGILGSLLGVYILSDLGVYIEPAVTAGLMFLGFKIFCRGITNKKLSTKKSNMFALGFVGGFCDATGGGGWGPIVTSNLVLSGNDVKKAIGTVNTVEFFITIVQSVSFVILLQDLDKYLLTAVGLTIGGAVGAPIAPIICGRIQERFLLIAVGILLFLLNSYNLYDLLY